MRIPGQPGLQVMVGGPRRVGSPLIPTIQSIATSQQGGDAAHDQRQDEQS